MKFSRKDVWKRKNGTLEVRIVSIYRGQVQFKPINSHGRATNVSAKLFFREFKLINLNKEQI